MVNDLLDSEKTIHDTLDTIERSRRTYLTVPSTAPPVCEKQIVALAACYSRGATPRGVPSGESVLAPVLADCKAAVEQLSRCAKAIDLDGGGQRSGGRASSA